MAVTRERGRSGANQTPASTGSQPRQSTPDEEHLQVLETQLATAKRQRNGPATIAIKREIDSLEWELARAG